MSTLVGECAGTLVQKLWPSDPHGLTWCLTQCVRATGPALDPAVDQGENRALQLLGLCRRWARRLPGSESDPAFYLLSSAWLRSYAMSHWEILWGSVSPEVHARQAGAYTTDAVSNVLSVVHEAQCICENDDEPHGSGSYEITEIVADCLDNLARALGVLGGVRAEDSGPEPSTEHLLALFSLAVSHADPMTFTPDLLEHGRPEVQVAWDLLQSRWPAETRVGTLGDTLERAHRLGLDWAVPIERLLAERCAEAAMPEVRAVLGSLRDTS